MSIILDALRRGRGTQTPEPNPKAAQTDAVLQTLGYGRFNPTTPWNRLKRALGYLALAVVLAIALWVAVVRLTRTFWAPTSSAGGAAARQAEPSVDPKPVPGPVPPVVAMPALNQATAPNAPVAPIASASAPASASATTSASAPSATADKTADKPIAPNRRVVQNSQRVTIPDLPPPVPTGAPSRTGLSAAARRAATVTTGEDHFTRGMMYQRLGEFENALVSYQLVLQRDDFNVEAHNNLGVLYRDKGLFDDAIRHFQRAIAINPNYARARNNLGVVYLSQRKFDMSATQFHAALAIDPKNVESMVNLSTVEKESGRREEARRWLTRAIHMSPRNAEAHYNLGLLEDEAGTRTQALSHYRSFLQYGAASHATLVVEVRKRIEALEAK